MIESNIKNANILIVDDQLSNIEILVDLLEVNDYTSIMTISDSRNVIEAIQSFKPDLLLLDLMMPYLSGYEIMEQFKTINSTNEFLPILVLTADISDEAKWRALKAGAKDFITKPFDLVEVSLRIHNLLETRYLYQQQESRNLILEEIVQERTSELLLMNTELTLAKEKAEASDRLKSAFLQNISHEVRTPLNGILGFAHLVVEPNLAEEDKKQYIEVIQDSSNRLLKTITDYVDISLLVSGNTKIQSNDVFPSLILDSVFSLYKKLCDEKKLHFELKIPADASKIRVKSDHLLLQKAITHIVDNAIKFTNNGSVTFGFIANKNEIQFFVEDTGIGIDETVYEKIFGSFIQENDTNTRDYEGSGLGLTIAKKVLELLGGSIWFTTEKGKGTTFYFSVPLTNQS